LKFNFNYLFLLIFNRPCVRINCYNNADWPNANKDEINNAIKKCLEVFFSIFKYKILNFNL